MHPNYTCLLLFGLLNLAKLSGQTLRSIQPSQFTFESATYLKTEDKLYAVVADDRNIEVGHSNSLLVIHPSWGKVEAKFKVGFNPRMLCKSSDEQFLFFVCDGPRSVKRFNVQAKKIEQEVFINREVLRIMPVPGQSQSLLVLEGTADSMFLRTLENNRFLPDKIAMHRANPVIGMGFSNDNTLFLWRNNGEILKIKVNNDGLVQLEEFTGYSFYSLDDGLVTSNRIITASGKVFNLSGQRPVEEQSLPNAPSLFNLSEGYNVDEFAVLQFLGEGRFSFVRYNKNTLAEVYRWSSSFFNINFNNNFTQLEFYVSGPERFCFNSGGSINLAWNCSPAYKIPVLSRNGTIVQCPFADSLILKVDRNDVAEVVWTNGSTLPNLVVSTNGAYSAKYTDANGCQTFFSAPAKVSFTYGSEIQTIQSENRDQAPIAICRNSKIDLRAISYDELARYRWSNGDTTQIVRVPAGVYRVRALGRNGCLGPWSNPFELTESADSIPVKPRIQSISGSNQFCSSAPAVIQTTPGYQYYYWNNFRSTSNKQESSFFTNSKYTTKYTVRVAKNIYCISEPSDTITLDFFAIPTRPQIRLENGNLISNLQGIHQWYLNDVLIRGFTGASIPVQGGGFYSAKYVLNNCASSFSNFFPVSGKTTATESINSPQALRVFPNPGSDVITMDMPSVTGINITAQIITSDGRKVNQPKVAILPENQVQISISELKPGLYVVELLSEGQRYLGKFIKL